VSRVQGESLIPQRRRIFDHTMPLRTYKSAAAIVVKIDFTSYYYLYLFEISAAVVMPLYLYILEEEDFYYTECKS
jgi:hypothetical protein